MQSGCAGRRIRLLCLVVRQEWSTEDLIGSWTLVGEDWRLVGNKTGATRLGFGLLLKFFELEVRFPQKPEEVPAYMAEQLKVDASEFAVYSWAGRSVKYHRKQIREEFGFREFSVGDDDKLTGWMAGEVCPVELRDQQLREALLVRYRSERVEPPTPGRIDRLLGSAHQYPSATSGFGGSAVQRSGRRHRTARTGATILVEPALRAIPAQHGYPTGPLRRRADDAPRASVL